MSEDRTQQTETEAGTDELLRRRLLDCAELMEAIQEDRSLLAALDQQERRRLLTAAGRVTLPDRLSKRQLASDVRRRDVERSRKADSRLLEETGLRDQARKQVFPTPWPDDSHLLGQRPLEQLNEPEGMDELRQVEERAVPSDGPELEKARNCYTCKRDYKRLDDFYHSLCPECSELNRRKREQTADLRGRTALVTGARVKIGYQAAIKLLRAGARVIAATRFPRDAATRYAAEPDFENWRDRLVIQGLDLRHTPSVVALADHLVATEERLDFLLNNACQTVRRPPEFYRHLMEAEQARHAELPESARSVLESHEALRRSMGGQAALLGRGSASALPGLERSAELSQLALLPEDLDGPPALFPEGRLDADLQQVDLREVNSWRLKLHEVPVVELLEVHLVNAVAPYVLNARLKPLMLRVPTRDKHVVNVSAMEGQFYRSFKTDRHPHTNMAKAALNMMTRTSAADYLKDGIHMTSVDTGWITDEDPIAHAERKKIEQGFHPPLDHVDAAARICDPIFHGFLTGEHYWGVFLKDYRPVRW